jgi:hypothetical protein
MNRGVLVRAVSGLATLVALVATVGAGVKWY